MHSIRQHASYSSIEAFRSTEALGEDSDIISCRKYSKSAPGTRRDCAIWQASMSRKEGFPEIFVSNSMHMRVTAPESGPSEFLTKLA